MSPGISLGVSSDMSAGVVSQNPKQDFCYTVYATATICVTEYI